MMLIRGLIAAALVASACAPIATPSPPASGGPVAGGRIVEALLGDVSTLDPLRVSDGAQFDTAGPIISQLYDTLAVADRKTGEILPWLATWTVASDGRTYEFDIAPNALWSDGLPVIGQDFVTTLKALARTKTGTGRAGLSQIEGFNDYKQGKATAITGVRAEGKHLTIRFGATICAALNVPLQTPPLPTQVFGKYLSDTDPSKNADAATEHLAPPVSSGPFVFDHWRHGEEIVLRANPTYWKGAPLLGELTFRNVDHSTVRAALRNGSVDVVFGTLRDLDLATVHELDRDTSVRVLRNPTPGYTYMGWNVRSGVTAFEDKRIRQALAYGLDVDLAIKQILQGEGGRTRQDADVTSWAYAQGLNEYPYDPAKAEALIRSAGYAKGADGIFQRDGHPLAFTLVTNGDNPVRSALAQFATDQYRAIGVSVTPRLISFDSLADKLNSGDPTIEAFVLGWVRVGDPNPTGIWHSIAQSSSGVPANLDGYINADVDKALDAGRFGPDCSLAARKRAYDTFNRILNEDQPYNFLYWQNQFVIMSSRVRGLTPGTYVPLPDAHLWWLTPRR